ncbi:LPS-assembly protein LptD [Vicingus serpentipes]|uniref:LPS-assembly protein LptD n=1 Tax=Vicingus serpentipes TaxID=1926625 RepID=A0A5C6RYE4_9FLAO|nr:putative LPS assembly protein LptD [Vicingus serpentipes]TXB66670.1 LPS-assembly protein LptD [Vicingus serpentipes]
MKNNIYTNNLKTFFKVVILLFIVLPSLGVAQTDTTRTDSLVVLTIDSFISKDALESKVKYKATDSIRFDMKSQQVFLFGESEIYYEDIELKAEEIESDLDSNVVTARGKQDSTGKYFGEPIFKQATKEFNAHEIKYNFNTKKGLITDVKTQEGGGYIHGNKIYKNPDNILYIKNGKYTTCNLAEPHYHFGATKLKVIPNDKIITGPADLFIENAPTPFAIPFGFFPNSNKQRSGIVIPEPGESAQYGFFMLNGGYYLYVNEHLDAQLTGDFYSKGSWGAKFNSNYKDRYHFNGNVNLSYSVFKNSEKEFPDFSERKDFFFRWRHNQDPKARPNSVFSANVNFGTTTNFTNNFNSTSNDYLSSTANSSISYTKRFGNSPFTLNLNASHSQNNLTKLITVRLPDIALNMARIYPLKRKNTVGSQRFYEKIGFGYAMSARNEVTALDSLFNINEPQYLTEKFKNGMRHNIPINTSLKVFKYFSLTPSFNYSEIWYLKTINKNWSDTSNSVYTDTINGFARGNSYNMSANLTTKVFGMYSFKSKNIKALRHVITPSVGLSYVPENNSGLRSYTDSSNTTYDYSIFQDGIYGTSNTVEAGLLNFGLLQNFEMKVRNRKDTINPISKITLIDNLGLTTNYNMLADSFNWSNISLTARTSIFKKINLNFNSTIDPYALDTNGTRVNKSHYSQEGGLGRLTNANLAASFSLRSKTSHKKEKESKFATEEELAYINSNLDDYIDFDIPWTLNIGYNVNYSKPQFEDSKRVIQTLNFSGDVSLTKKWKVGFSSGYDFQNHKYTYTTINIYRDLHCWEMSMQWVPIGFRQSYTFTIKVKSSILQDLKLTRRNIPSVF